MADTRTPLARARGLGAARGGVHHWWMQRLTAIALVPLTVWFVAGLVSLSGAPWAAVVAWLGQPVRAALAVAFLVLTFHHGQLGMQAVIEDYVHHEGWKLGSLIAVKLLAALLALLAILAVLRMALSGGAPT